MMKQLKGLGYLKSLKLLFSILLIGFFGLGVSSFVSSYNIIENCYTGASSSCSVFDNSFPCWEIGNNEEFVYGNYTYKVDNNANFKSSYQGGDYYNSLIFKQVESGYNKFGYFYWGIDNKLHNTITRNSNGDTVDYLSGGVCIVNSNDIKEIASMCGFWVQNSGPESCVSGIPRNYLADINLFYNTNGGFDKIYFLPGISNNGGTYAKPGRFCFVKGDTGYCLYSQYKDSLSLYSPIGDVILNSTDFKNTNFNVENSSNSFYLSPFNGGNGGDSGSGDSSVNSGVFYNNQNVYNSLYHKGYRKQLCYGGFGLDDLFLTGSSSFSGIVAGSGATVFDLFNTYSGGLDFNTWYDNNYLDYIYLKEFKDYYEYSNFLDKSKGLVGLGLVRDSFFKGDSFNTSDYRYFCNLVINFSGSIDTSNDSPLSFLDDSLSENLIFDIIGDIDILIPTSGSALDFTIQNLCESGDLSGALCSGDFSGYNSDLWGSIQSSRNTWSVDISTLTEYNGILPTYIVVGFMSILLLYYFRR